MVTPVKKMLNTAKVFLVGLACLSAVQGSERKTSLLKKSNKAEQREEVSEAPRITLDNFCETYFDMKANWELNYPFILQRERGLEECRTWDLDEAINRQVESEEDDGKAYYPMESLVGEMENQAHPRKSVVSRVMMQYRRDLGFSGNIDFVEPMASVSEVSQFISCLIPEPEEPEIPEKVEKVGSVSMEPAQNETEEQKRERIKQQNREADRRMIRRIQAEMREEKKQEKFKQLIEAYTFLKEQEIIKPGMTCEEFKDETDIESVDQFRNFYRKELEMYTLLNWDYLDLTPFEYHHFPITDHFTRSVTHFGYKEEVSPPIMMPSGIEILRRYVNNIRFHNPRTLEGRKMLLFQRLYRRYYKTMGKEADPSFIDWSHCVAINWPEDVSRIDLYAWVDKDVALLNQLIDSDQLVFEKAPVSKKQTKTYRKLGQKDSFSSRKPIRVNFDTISEDTCGLSDDEAICGPPAQYNDALEEVIENRDIQNDIDKAYYERRHKMRYLAPVNEEKKASTSVKSSDTGFEMFSVLVVSDEPADPVKRERALAKALEIFRKTSGHPEATEIDWSLTNLAILQNHILPFATDLETEGHVKTLENLMKSGSLKFNNLKQVKGRINDLYQKLYKKYAAVVGIEVHPFLIRWKDIDVTGFPEGVPLEYNKWTRASVDAIQSCFEDIQFTAKSLKKRAEKSKSSRIEGLERSGSQGSGILKNFSIETTGPINGDATDFLSPNYSSFIVSTPTSETAEISPINKKRVVKRKIANISIVGDAKEPEGTERRRLDSVTGFGDLTPEQFNILVTRLNGTIEKFKAARDSANINDRVKRILSEIIRGFNLLLDHTNEEIEAPLVSVQQIQEFIAFCRDCLPKVMPDGSMNDEDLREFVVRSIRFRALLYGATPLPEKDRNKRSNIHKSMISDSGLFDSLLGAESNWEIGILEFFLEDESNPIFVGKKSKRGRKKQE